MIRRKLNEITIRDYSECLNGNTLVLHSGLKLFRRKLQRKCDATFIEISDEMTDKMKSESGNIIFKMFAKMRRGEIKLRAFIAAYQVLQMKHLAKLPEDVARFEQTIKHLQDFGFVWKQDKTDEMNLRLLAGQIDRLKSINKITETDYAKILESYEGKSQMTIEEIVITLNRAIGQNVLTLNSYLSEFVAAANTAKKLTTKS